MAKEGNTKPTHGKFVIPALYLFSIALIITLSIISLTYKTVPSISSGATPEDISEYARSLVTDNPGNGEIYDEAATYFANQIAKAPTAQDQFNLQLDYALFLADTGDTKAGLNILDEIDAESLPLDARYYLYSTYAALYDQISDTTSGDEYRARIYNEGILEYIASLDGADNTNYTCPVELVEEEESASAEETEEEEPADEIEITEEETPDEAETEEEEEEDDGEEYVNLGEYKR